MKLFRLSQQQIKDLNLDVSLASSDLQLVKKIRITDASDAFCCLLLSNTAKKLYNSALYLFKKQYKLNQTVLTYETLDKFIKNERVFPKFAQLYRDLPAKVSQQVLKLFSQNINSFFALKQSEKLTEAQKKKINLPSYYSHNGLITVSYTNQALSKQEFNKEGVLCLSGTGLKIDRTLFPEIKHFSQINQVRIIPSSKNDKNEKLSDLLNDNHFYFTLEIIYTPIVSEKRKSNQILHMLYETIGLKRKNKQNEEYIIYKEEIAELYGTEEFMQSVAGIDQNLDQLSVGINVENKDLNKNSTNETLAFNYDIKYLKSVNQFWNKQKAKLQAELEEQQKVLFNLKHVDEYGNVRGLDYYKTFLSDYTISQLIEDTQILIKKIRNKIKRITTKRNHKIDNYTHQISRKLINHLAKLGVKNIIYGKNVDFKKEINLGKVNNQNFVNIPFNQIIERLKYKALLAGINFMTVEESYTSKTSFLDKEKLHSYKDNKPSKKYSFLGQRFSRSVFRSEDGYVIHADINASFNIIRKVSGDKIYNHIDFGSIKGSSPKRVKIALQ